MKRKTILFALLVSVVLAGFSNADIDISHMTGVGARAYGLANNFVALSNDQSGLFWNPAGLAFVPAREFQIGFDGLSQRANTDFLDKTGTSVVQRLRLVNLGYLHAFPATQGGLTIAGALQNPYTFDDVRNFSGSYQIAGNKTVDVSRNSRNYGGLNYWTGGFGLQVAEGLGLGVSASFVLGSALGQNIFYRDTNGVLGDSIYDNYNDNINRTYMGYDIRFGLLYNFSKHFNLGMRFVLPQTIWFTEDRTETNPHTNLGVYTYPTEDGKIFSSYSGAVGFSGTFPFMTFSTEFRARAPYSLAYPAENIPDSSLAAKTLIGAGIGLEIPLFVSTTLLRAGYSWDQYDTHLFARQYDNADLNYPAGQPNWDPEGEAPVGDQQLVTLGVAFIMKSACLEISYGYNFWKLETNNQLTETHSQNRVMTSLAFRF
jgi:hypothetical protein